ncbi:hypothetical protein CK203_075539 [Vitis vinifera]|uniref:Myb/SANT-like domain-containing protein n=1 Tax=Vitis vinifera TaxID=29760 RepID=A0A438DT71_VITVI|nr:hypothetical protein CK203_075539 [Vitis vinifera]
MSATQDGILGRPKAEWTPSRDAYLVELFIEQHNCGRTAYNEFKVEVYKSVTNDFNRKFGMNLEENQIKNRYNVMKKDYGIVKTLLSHPGFAWDDIRQMVVADDKIWTAILRYEVMQGPFDAKAFLWERPSGRYQFPSGVLLEPEEENSNTETVRSSEPSNLPTQVVDGALDSDSIFHINDAQPKKRKSTGPVTSSRKRRACDRVGDKLENVLYEMFSAASFKCLQRNAIKEQTMYQKCLEELQGLEELDDSEFTKAVNVLRDDKNAIAFMTIKGPRRLTWLRNSFHTVSWRILAVCACGRGPLAGIYVMVGEQ